ncbi:HNH endonuclease signature motif containing protein [Spirillospora sp. NPDC047279]|uniref:HNH endonuclease n=1 Tax=Spirillospora sp. NPDC047279 TaxID=3155478 RepID=UPI00340D75CB
MSTMARAPKLCAADCRGIATKGPYCDAHRPVPFAGAKERWNAQRPSNWRKLRADVIDAAGGVCDIEDCEEAGTDVDHIDPVAERGLWRLNNLQLLCKPHHKIKVQQEAQRGRQRARERRAA